VCKIYSFNIQDDVYMNKFKCCFKCYVKHVEGRDGYVECELWIENSKGDKTTTGSALVILPLTKSKSK